MRELLFRGQTRRKGEKILNMRGDPAPSKWVYGGVFQGAGDFSVMYSAHPVENMLFIRIRLGSILDSKTEMARIFSRGTLCHIKTEKLLER